MDRNYTFPSTTARTVTVATREGGVDRNAGWGGVMADAHVATREGGVDRNQHRVTVPHPGLSVATREGGVDRNVALLYTAPFQPESPPARVAWIETRGRFR